MGSARPGAETGLIDPGSIQGVRHASLEPHPRAPPAAADTGAIAALLAEDAPGSRCGWFESSYELRQGLEISELPDATVEALWVQQASGCWLH